MDVNSTTKLCPCLKISHNDDSRNFVFTADIICVIINAFLSIPSMILNLLLILSIIKTPSLRKPSFILICCLAVTDFGVGLLIQPLFIARKIAFLYSNVEVYCSLLKAGNVLSHIVCSPSFFVVTAISIDRYFAIRLQTRYKQVITNRRVYKFLIGCLMGACLVTTARFHATRPEHMGYAAALMFILLVVIVCCYIKSLNKLKAHHVHIHNLHTPSQRIIQTILHKKTLKTLLIITSVLFICYIPFVTVVIVISKFGRNRSLTIAWEGTVTLVYVYSFLNPVVHLCRCKQIRQACVALMRRNKVGVAMLEPSVLSFQSTLEKYRWKKNVKKSEN
ncbi:melanocyte-stimulating hormone receptor-like [Actinia tenebrosa]|uniref:Melanocyte-stimulating hormone receptor-like n=1 Tax=Actinia tenebrosa TaxID=6105 RepID=A0A6P8HYI4_ACTTE|nr:melanocyte-stimulating hormone receptor-like [Actinia tenebrosa]